MRALAYFITFRTYGTWLHGHAQGSVDAFHNEYGRPLAPADARRERGRRELLVHAPVELGAAQRRVVEATAREVCAHRGWGLHTVHARATHVHAVVTAQQAPERVMNDLKAYGTRRMREAGLVDAETRVWSHHGSTRYLTTENSVALAVHYVLHEQDGPPMTAQEPAGREPGA